MADSDSDDSDLGAFAFMSKPITIEEDEEVIQPLVVEEEVFENPLRYPDALCTLFLGRDVSGLMSLVALAEDSRKGTLSDLQPEKDCSSDSVERGSTACSAEELAVLQLAVDILEGRHLEVVQSAPLALSLPSLLALCKSDKCIATQVRELVSTYISSADSAVSRSCRARQVLLLGSAWLELYCQENYTGPELNPVDVAALYGYGYGTELLPNGSRRRAAALTDAEDAEIADLRMRCIQHLEVDGVYAFSVCAVPHALLLARSLLLPLADPERAPWKAGITLSASGAISKARANEALPPLMLRAIRGLRCSAWLGARACMIHTRAMQSVSVDALPTLWNEAQDLFAEAKAQHRAERYDALLESSPDYCLIAQLWLEVGLSFHHFDHSDKGKSSFKQAQLAAGLQTILTGALGKRTKHQQKDYAQLLLLVRSGLLEGRASAELVDSNAGIIPDDSNIIRGGGLAGLDLEDVDASGLSVRRVKGGELVAENALVDSRGPGEGKPESVYGENKGWEHGQWEVGRRMVAEAAGGQEAAVREVMLDSQDGGASENILLEGGPHFSDAAMNQGGKLHVVDQAVVLALCLDVTNSNADEGLTREEKEPYLQKVLQEAKSWMIHSTGLLERSWLEFEKGRSADRAMLQMQALLDQHTTKLTVMQSTFQSVTEDSAPAQERLSFLHCIAYPAQYELKRDLAQRYLRSQVVASALVYFRELELWDEVVMCYQLMDKPHRAEMVVRDRLKVSRSPYMVCALADLTGKEELYEQAWELSNHRYARAKRTLGKACFDRGEYEACVRHMDAALVIAPMVAWSWYIKGVATMRLSQWDEALLAFSRCVQQDSEVGEAWANSGSIHMHLKQYPKALMAFEEAYKYKRDSWRLLENIMAVCLLLNKFPDCIAHMNTLLDMREQSDRPVHKQELRRLCFMTAAVNRKAVRDNAAMVAAGRSAEEIARARESDINFKLDMKQMMDEDQDEFLFVGDDDMDRTCLAVENLLLKITSTIDSDPEVWDIFADFEISLGRLKNVLGCRVRQFRGLLNEPSWEKHEHKMAALAKSAHSLAAIHFTKAATKADLYACASMLNSALRKISILFADSPEHTQVTTLVQQINKLHGEA